MLRRAALQLSRRAVRSTTWRSSSPWGAASWQHSSSYAAAGFGMQSRTLFGWGSKSEEQIPGEVAPTADVSVANSEPVQASSVVEAQQQQSQAVLVESDPLDSLPSPNVPSSHDLLRSDNGVQVLTEVEIEPYVPLSQASGSSSFWDYLSPIEWSIWIVEQFHDHMHLPWWGSIVAMSVVTRFLLFPTTIMREQHYARQQNAQPEILKLRGRATKRGGDPHAQMFMQQETMRIMARHGAQLHKQFIPMVMSLPVMIGGLMGCRRMANEMPEVMADGGFLWWPDLAASDPTYILPVLSCISFLAMSEQNFLLKPESAKNMPKVMRTVIRGMPFFMLLFAHTMPCTMFVYWIPASSATIFVQYLFTREWLKRLTNVPIIDHDRIQDARLKYAPETLDPANNPVMKILNQLKKRIPILGGGGDDKKQSVTERVVAAQNVTDADIASKDAIWGKLKKSSVLLGGKEDQAALESTSLESKMNLDSTNPKHRRFLNKTFAQTVQTGASEKSTTADAGKPKSVRSKQPTRSQRRGGGRRGRKKR